MLGMYLLDSAVRCALIAYVMARLPRGKAPSWAMWAGLAAMAALFTWLYAMRFNVLLIELARPLATFLYCKAFYRADTGYALFLSMACTLLMGVWGSLLTVLPLYAFGAATPGSVALLESARFPIMAALRAATVLVATRFFFKVDASRRISAREGLLLLSPALANQVVPLFLSTLAYQCVDGDPWMASHAGLMYLVVCLVVASSIYTLFGTEDYFRRQELEQAISQNAYLSQLDALSRRARVERDQVVREMYHDMRNHLSAIAQSRGMDEARAYIGQLMSGLEPARSVFNTGNATLDIVLDGKAAQARERGVGVECTLDFSGAGPVPQSAVCAVFANALDNAIEAAAATEGERKVRVRGGTFGPIVSVRIENPSAAPLLLGDDGLPRRASPSDGRGVGCLSMRRALDGIGGEMAYECAGGTVALSIVIPAQAAARDGGAV